MAGGGWRVQLGVMQHVCAQCGRPAGFRIGLARRAGAKDRYGRVYGGGSMWRRTTHSPRRRYACKGCLADYLKKLKANGLSPGPPERL